MSKEWASNEEYLASGGTHCPYCGSKSAMATGPCEVDGMTGWMPVKCEVPECGKEWTDEFRLVGYAPVE